MTESEKLTTGMIGKEVRLEFTQEWDHLTKTAVFVAGEVTRDVVDISDVVTIPAEVLANPMERLYVGVYGVSGDGALVIPTIHAPGPVIAPGADPSGDESTDAALPVWAQLQNQIDALKDSTGGSTGEDAVPAHWLPALQEGAAAINTALCNAGRNKSAFLFYTDAHWNYGSQNSPMLLKYLYQHTGMTKTNFGGDIVNNEGTDYDTMSYLWAWRSLIKGLNHHSVPGNHDDGNAINNLFSEKYVYGYLLAPEETSDIVWGDSGLYYYIDDSSERTRYLYLDTAYRGLTEDQKAFVNDALKSTPEGWHIVAIAHIWVDTDYDVTPPVPGEINEDAAVLLAVFDNYNARSGIFADCGGWVEFCIGGHTHWDYDTASPNGIPVILVETDSWHVRSGLGYTAGTTTEASVNGIIADYDAHEIHVVRVGRGSSRTVSITNYTVSYTNVLPLAVAADGVSIYNADGTPGYKADTRWSTSSNAEVTASGIYLTGWIPVAAGDVIRLANVVMPQTVGNTCIVHIFTENNLSAPYDTVNSSVLPTHWQGQWGEDGNLSEFTIRTDANYTHIRIQASQLTEASVITVNENIL